MREKRRRDSPNKKPPVKKKIKVHVESLRGDKGDRRKKSNERKQEERRAEKKETAELVVKYTGPYFRRGQVASKEVFKFLARELTHVLVERANKGGITDTNRFAKEQIAAFFAGGTIVYSTDDAKEKARAFQSTLR